MEQSIKVKHIVYLIVAGTIFLFLTQTGLINLPQNFDAEESYTRLSQDMTDTQSVLTNEQKCQLEKLRNKRGWFTLVGITGCNK